MALRFLVTAGPTREYIDPVRYISNESSGRMGFAVASAAAAAGHLVTLVHGPVAIRPPRGVRAVPVISAAEMLIACRGAWPRCDVLIMVAAVADYTPARPLRLKKKKSPADLTLRLKPTADILATLSCGRRPGQVAIGFALEDSHGRRNAAAKLQTKGLDVIVLNSPAALSSGTAEWEILERDGRWTPLPRGAKSALARRLVRLAAQCHADRLDNLRAIEARERNG